MSLLRTHASLATMRGKTYLTAMNAHTQLSAKGQIVIPKQVRDAHDWLPGTAFEVIDRPDGVLLRPTSRPLSRLSLADFNAAVPPHEGPPLTLEEMDAAVARLGADGIANDAP